MRCFLKYTGQLFSGLSTTDVCFYYYFLPSCHLDTTELVALLVQLHDESTFFFLIPNYLAVVSNSVVTSCVLEVLGSSIHTSVPDGVLF